MHKASVFLGYDAAEIIIVSRNTGKETPQRSRAILLGHFTHVRYEHYIVEELGIKQRRPHSRTTETSEEKNK